VPPFQIPPLRFLLAHTRGFSIGCLGLRRLSETPVQVGQRGVEPLVAGEFSFLVEVLDQGQAGGGAAVRRRSWKIIPGTPAFWQTACHALRKLAIGRPPRWKSYRTMKPLARSTSFAAGVRACLPGPEPGFPGWHNSDTGERNGFILYVLRLTKRIRKHLGPRAYRPARIAWPLASGYRPLFATQGCARAGPIGEDGLRDLLGGDDATQPLQGARLTRGPAQSGRGAPEPFA
jgi:hypothetical protein